MSQTLDLIMAAKNTTDAAFKQLETGLGKTEAQVKKLVPATDEWSNAQQRASQRMERMHEQALKMNTGLVATSDKSEILARNLNAVQGAVSSTASAFGVSTGALGPLNSAVDVASVGFNKLKTSAVGFNAASIGVAGAGLAVGAAIGTWLRTFPAVSKAADDAAAALVRLFTSQKDLDAQANATQGLAKFQAEMAASHEAATKRQVETLRGMGLSVAQILDTLDGKHKTSADTYIETLRKEEAALKKFNAEQAKAAELSAKVAEKIAKSISNAAVTWTGAFMQMPNAIKPAEAAMIDFTGVMETEIPIGADRLRELGMVIDETTGLWTQYADVVDQELENATDAVEEHADSVSDFEKGVKAFDTAMQALNVAMQAYESNALEGAIAGARFGAQFGPMEAAIGGAIGGLLGMFGAEKRAREEQRRLDDEMRRNIATMVRMRDEFIRSQGGLEALEVAARAAGVSLEAMLDAKTVEAYEAAIREVQEALDLFEEGTRQTLEALDKWGISIDKTSAAFQHARFQEQAAQFLQELELISLAGVSFADIVESEMWPTFQAFIQDAITSGRALPEFMREWIDKMIEAGLLLDENGQKITDTSQLTFTETLEAGVGRLITQLERLIRVMQGLPAEVSTNVNVNYHHNNPPPTTNPNLLPGEPGGGGEPTTGMAAGGWFPFRPGGYGPFVVGEESDEAIIPKDAMAGIIAQAMQMAGGAGGGGSQQPIVLHIYLDGQPMRDWIIKNERVGALTRS